jgi:hypothetical protein
MRRKISAKTRFALKRELEKEKQNNIESGNGKIEINRAFTVEWAQQKQS